MDYSRSVLHDKRRLYGLYDRRGWRPCPRLSRQKRAGGSLHVKAAVVCCRQEIHAGRVDFGGYFERLGRAVDLRGPWPIQREKKGTKRQGKKVSQIRVRVTRREGRIR